MESKQNESTRLKTLRKRAKELVKKNPAAVKKIPPRDIQKLIEELQIHQVELEMQNEELRKTQLELEVARDKYSDLYDFAPVGYIASSPEGLILEANLTVSKMLAVERSVLIGKPFTRFITREDQDTYYFHRQKLLETKGKQTCELKLKKKDDDPFHAQLECILIKDAEGDVTQIRTVVTDITERKQIAAEKKNLEVQIRQAHKMEAVGTLAGGIAHDFNNILGIILGNTELALTDVPEWNPARMNLEEARTACLRAKDVISQLLSFAHKTEVKQKPLKIIPVIRESLKLLRASIPTSIDIRQDIPDDIDIILADPVQINQVLINLCTNATHAMPDGGVLEVRLENEELTKENVASGLEPGRYVKLRVTDTGEGIAPGIIDRIFDPYYTTRDVGRGSGIGLAVVHGIVQSHNGAITVASEPGKGSRFDIFFPPVEREVVDDTEDDEQLPVGDEGILFVDDEASIVNIVQQMLERLGYQVTALTSSLEALEVFNSDPDRFDLVISDMTMPKMEGDRLVKAIREIRPDIPVILCTGYSEKMSPEKADALGIKSLLMKPLVMSVLAKSVRESLD